MGRLPALYPIISYVAGILLLVAGVLKAQEAYQDIGVAGWQPALAAGELLFGAWLLVGLFPRWSRLLALLVFGVFLHVALSMAFEGKASCSCFGKVTMRPWQASAIDAAMIVALLLCPARRTTGPTETSYGRARWGAFGVVAVAVAVWFALPLLKSSRTNIGESVMPTGPVTPAGQDQLTTLIDALERNHQKLENLDWTCETTSVEKLDEKYQARTGRPAEVVQRGTVRCVIRGADSRRDFTGKDEKGIAIPGDTEVIVRIQGRRIQSVPSARFASLATAKLPDQNHLESSDLRCAGFQPPLNSIADWLRACEVRSVAEAVDRAGRKVIHLRVLAAGGGGKWKDDIEADCVPGFNYLPSRVVYRDPEKHILFGVTDIEYAVVPGTGAWFPKKITQRYYPRAAAAKDPNSEQEANPRSIAVVHSVALGEPVSKDLFDPMIPADTPLVGDLRTQIRTGSKSVRASSIMRGEPIQILASGTPPKTGRRIVAWAYWFPFGLSLLLASICVIGRKRFDL